MVASATRARRSLHIPRARPGIWSRLPDPSTMFAHSPSVLRSWARSNPVHGPQPRSLRHSDSSPRELPRRRVRYVSLDTGTCQKM